MKIVIRVLAHVVGAFVMFRLLLVRLQKMLQNVDGQREDDGRILLGRDRVERLEVAQLQKKRKEKKTQTVTLVLSKKECDILINIPPAYE